MHNGACGIQCLLLALTSPCFVSAEPRVAPALTHFWLQHSYLAFPQFSFRTNCDKIYFHMIFSNLQICYRELECQPAHGERRMSAQISARHRARLLRLQSCLVNKTIHFTAAFILFPLKNSIFLSNIISLLQLS